MSSAKRNLSWLDVQCAVHDLSLFIRDQFSSGRDPSCVRLYGVPRGGGYIVAMLGGMGYSVVGSAGEADIIVDDIIDSGSTREHYHTRYAKPFVAPFESKGEWLVFPWEHDEQHGAEDNVRRLLQSIGEDPTRDGLLVTPGRYVRALGDLTRGYDADPATILATVFSEHHDEMIVLRDVPFWSLCEHHMLPFHGVAHIGYVPSSGSGKIVGLSKLARLLDCYARRLQVQERLTDQVATALMEHLDAAGAACVIEGTHLCMAMRGVEKAGVMVTSSLLGVMREGAVRSEFLRLIGK